MMKRSILIASLTVFVASLASVQNADAQIFRHVCPSGACPNVASYQRVYNPYSYARAQSVAPCETAQVVQPCEPATETVEAPEPCAPCAPVAEIVEPCAPVQTATTCTHEEYLPTEQGNVCVNGTCPIRTLTKTAVKATANTAKGAVQTVAATTRWLLAVNRVRTQYNLPALKADVNLDAGCASHANYCARTGRLVHGSGVAEILAQNQSGIDAAIIQWLNSPAHRSLMLSPSYRFAGVSVVRGNDGRVWCAMRFR